MKKKILVVLLCLMLMGNSVYATNVYEIKYDTNRLQVSLLENTSNIKTKVLVEKDGLKYIYNIKNKQENIPFTQGLGVYSVKILEHISGTRYKVIKKQVVDVTQLDNFLGSNQPVYWENQEKTIQLGKELTLGMTDKDKVTAVYNYIVNTITYDTKKAKTVDDTYVPEIDKILEAETGICYDYAALFAGVLRSQGIPTKLVKGYKTDMTEYHAWNEVLVDGEWKIVDTTYDAAYKGSRTKQSMFKPIEQYNILKTF